MPSKKCIDCGERNKKRNTGGCCKECFKKSLQKACPKCSREFIPLRKNQRNCGKCGSNKGKSVWQVASAGLPGLGKRR